VKWAAHDPVTLPSGAVRLSVLDQAPIAEGSTGVDALRNSLGLAKLAEELGYARYWVAEHHGTPMLACASPEILVAEAANATSRIRVGSGGVMLSHYSPFKVAEQFSILAGLHGDRIDLGVGRAPGADLETIYALQRDRREPIPDDFVSQVDELLAYFGGGFPAGHPFEKLVHLPGSPAAPDVWMLGMSPETAIWAGERGLPYAVADFVNPGSASSARLYREAFRTGRRAEPKVSVAVGVVCAETRKEADEIASSWKMAITIAGRGEFGPVPEPGRALAFLRAEPPHGDGFAGRRVVVGPPGSVRARLHQIAAEYEADELVILTLTHDDAARRRSYELLAEEYSLEP
jgi:luciferase family oxidoreductase group 1